MIKGFQIGLLPQHAHPEQAIIEYLAKEKGIDARTMKYVRVLERSIDAWQRTMYMSLSLRMYISGLPQDEGLIRAVYPDVSQKPRVIVVGVDPAGLFAALRLIEEGFKPVVIGQGKNVRERKKDLAMITKTQKVDAESNYCFDEDGTGAYSNGKLYTRSRKRGSAEKILNVFCQHGASTSILADAYPHIGTDKLPKVTENMQNTIINSRGEIHFKTKIAAFLLSAEGDEVLGVETVRLSSRQEVTFRGPIILATGHNTRDVYRYLSGAKIEIEPKGLAVGVRLEYPPMLIDQIQYHDKQSRGKHLPAAKYSFVSQVERHGVYLFCMCPDGFVIPSAAGPKQIVVNGMSPSNRETRWSNAGMMMELHPGDAHQADLLIPSDGKKLNDNLVMVQFQEQLECTCWLQGNRRQAAPAQRMADFVDGKLSYDLPTSSYAPSLVSSPLHLQMPQFIVHRLQGGFKRSGQTSRGFLTNRAVVIAVETRTSSPVRILRDRETLQRVRVRDFFPCGEDVGYAGNIVSAGIDGERCAERCAAFLAE